jgi:hypothetical protein
MLFNESGEKHDYELSRNIRPTYIEWHPTLPTLAIGWENGIFFFFKNNISNKNICKLISFFFNNYYIGTITLWAEDTKMAKEEVNGHKEAITLI